MALSIQTSDAGHSSDWAFKRLFKLESECRSPTLAAQIQAVGQFPKLFDQFPFPTLVGSAFLKLGDLFCSSPNSLRYHIAHVFAASQHHLPHTAYTEELLRRVLVVLYSNDPIARVLALQLIGNGSVVFAKFPEAQHGVLLRYQSTHPLEVAAAVHTTEALLKYSPEFLSVVWETVIAKARDTSVLDTVRAQLIRSLRHAAPSLQLSTLLYDNCRFWMDQPGSTIAVKEATLAAWKAAIQPRNELKLVDAERVSCFVLHELRSIRCAALALLGTWRPKGSDSTMDVGSIKERLVTYIETQPQPSRSSFDFYCTRLAVISLARIEALHATTVAPQSWVFAESLANTASQEFSGLVSTNTRDVDVSDQSANPLLHDLVYATMLVINVASTLRRPELISSAAATVVSSWRAISNTAGSACNRRHVKRFLETTWIWCNRTGTQSSFIASLETMLETTNYHVFDAVIALSLRGRLGESFIARCTRLIEKTMHATSSDDMQNHNRNAHWNSTAILLAHHLQSRARLERPSSGMAPVDAIIKWCTSVATLDSNADNSERLYSSNGPLAHVCQTLIYLLAASGHWQALGLLVKALPSHRFGAEFQEWFDAILLLAEAEDSLDNTDQFLTSIDSSLSILHVLDNKRPRHTFQIFVVQIRKELAGLIDDCRKCRATKYVHPSSSLFARLQTVRTQELIAQVNFVLDAFLSVDSITRGWLEGVLATLSSITVDHTDTEVTPPSFTPGPSFFSMPPNPVIDIQTRPNLEAGGASVIAASGCQLHIIVEGFLQFSKHKPPVLLQGVRVAIWLSQRPKQGSDRDLLSCSSYNLVARSAKRQSTDTFANADDARGSGYDDCWDVALAFDAVLDGNYFACPCTVTMPQLGAAYSHHDATVSAHIHVSCALIDSSDRVWWVGPHNSYPLTISTTAK
ncbi:hypothetical protein H4S07_002733 [Coemansia furcata]|uniref:Uncharacterized protein n=1 Tax=Coemansia furcata TaxID=417177 RepID=A0ACC1LJV5_9FUNG|nr:hypothetical protein H4S07_002733 [Coemansia furcata]